ncbi:MAG: hypothetical protein WD512_16505 [Candidatus Paceibacterota bacterium]
MKIIRRYGDEINDEVVAELNYDPIFVCPCIIESESDEFFCAIPDGIHHIFISQRNGNGVTVIE